MRIELQGPLEWVKDILRDFIKESEAKIGHRSINDIAGYGKEIEPEKLAKGWYKLASMAVMARDALENDDEREIRREAVRCLLFEREARRALERYQRRQGGKRRGAEQSAKVDEVWEPCSRMYYQLLNAGVAPRKARADVIRKMTDDSFLDPISGEFPDRKTISKHLKKRKKVDTAA
jgi:hypothetical protein